MLLPSVGDTAVVRYATTSCQDRYDYTNRMSSVDEPSGVIQPAKQSAAGSYHTSHPKTRTTHSTHESQCITTKVYQVPHTNCFYVIAHLHALPRVGRVSVRALYAVGYAGSLPAQYDASLGAGRAPRRVLWASSRVSGAFLK